MWKCIARGWEGFVRHVRYETGDGSKVLFWHDVWCGELPLKILFPEWYTIACDKDAWVDENMEILNGIIYWNVMFIRPIYDWQIDVVSRFLNCCIPKVRYGGENKICWVPSKRKMFEVKSYYQVLYSGTSVWSLEEYLENYGSPESGFFCVASSSRKSLNFGQFTKDEYYGDGVVLHA